MLKSWICLVLILMNVFFSFTNHEYELEKSLQLDQSQSYILQSDSDSDGNRGLTVVSEHSCHLGHCGFILANYQMSSVFNSSSNSQSIYTRVSSPYLDEEIRPPIYL